MGFTNVPCQKFPFLRMGKRYIHLCSVFIIDWPGDYPLPYLLMIDFNLRKNFLAKYIDNHLPCLLFLAPMRLCRRALGNGAKTTISQPRHRSVTSTITLSTRAATNHTATHRDCAAQH